MGFFGELTKIVVKSAVDAYQQQNQSQTKRSNFNANPIYNQCIKEFFQYSDEDLLGCLYGFYLRGMHNAENGLDDDPNMRIGSRAIRDILIERWNTDDDEIDALLLAAYNNDTNLNKYTY